MWVYFFPNVRAYARLLSIASSLHLLAASQGNFGEAESMYERCLAIRKKAQGHGHSAVPKKLKN